MLTKITMNNFKSFKNQTTVDLTKTNYTVLPKNVSENGDSERVHVCWGKCFCNPNIILSVSCFWSLFSERSIIPVCLSACLERDIAIRWFMIS